MFPQVVLLILSYYTYFYVEMEKTPFNIERRLLLSQERLCVSQLTLAAFTTSEKALGSRTAISASILRFIFILACFMPWIS